jgi:hypothetical protein
LNATNHAEVLSSRPNLAGREAMLVLDVQRLARVFFCDESRRCDGFVGSFGWIGSVLLGFGKEIRSCAVGRVHVKVGRLARR